MFDDFLNISSCDNDAPLLTKYREEIEDKLQEPWATFTMKTKVQHLAKILVSN